MEYLHDNSLVHGDLKGVRLFRSTANYFIQRHPFQSNILIDKTLHPRLADFGLTRLVDKTGQSSTNMGGTLRWMAPELLVPSEDVQRTYASDIYAFACVCVEVSTFPLNFLPKLTTL